MFVLRKITGSGVEINIEMGDGYTLITKECNPKEFEDMKGPNEDDCIYAFIVCEGGSKVLPLSNKQKSFIMTGSGNTFANVSQRCQNNTEARNDGNTVLTAAVKSDWDLRKCFEQLRFDKNHHLGLGDIRLTIAQQEEICELVERFYRCR